MFLRVRLVAISSSDVRPFPPPFPMDRRCVQHEWGGVLRVEEVYRPEPLPRRGYHSEQPFHRSVRRFKLLLRYHRAPPAQRCLKAYRY